MGESTTTLEDSYWSFERTIIGNEKLPTTLSEFPGLTKSVFKDLYSFDFLGLPEDHKFFIDRSI